MKSFAFLLLLSFSRYVFHTTHFCLIHTQFSVIVFTPRNVVTTSQLEAPVLVDGVLDKLYDEFSVNETTEYLFEYTFTTSELGKHY